MNMSEQQFLEKLGEILDVGNLKIVPETPLEAIGGWDSIGQLTALGFLDETFSVQPPSGYLATCRTVADVMALVRERLTD
jgi:acyl carrier protein